MDNYKFITAKSKEIFSKHKNEIPKQSLTFIEDSREIYANGVTFNSVSIPTDIITISNNTTNIGTFNDKTVKVKVGDISAYEFVDIDDDDETFTITSSIKNEVLVPYSDFVFKIDTDNIAYDIYTVLILPQNDLAISFPEYCICKDHILNVKADSGVLVEVHILDNNEVIIKTKTIEVPTKTYKGTVPDTSIIFTVDANCVGVIGLLAEYEIECNNTTYKYYEKLKSTTSKTFPKNYTNDTVLLTSDITWSGKSYTVSYYQEPTAPNIYATYSITSSTSDKSLIYSSYSNKDCIERIMINGTSNGVSTLSMLYDDNKDLEVKIFLSDTTPTSLLASMFRSIKTLKTVNFINCDIANKSDLSYLFYYCSSLESITGLFDYDLSNVTNLYYTFCKCSALSFPDVLKLKLSNKLTSLYYTFAECSLLTSIDTSEWNLENVTTMAGTFSNCLKLKSIDLSPLSKATKLSSINSILYNAEKLESIVLSAFTPSNSLYMSYAFAQTKIESLDLSGWDLSNVANIDYAFTFSRIKSITFGSSIPADLSCKFSYSTTSITSGILYVPLEYYNNFANFISAIPTTWTVKCIGANYSVDLNSKWEEATGVENPDTEVYDTLYRSYGNNSSTSISSNAKMYINITGYTEFTIYIRGYGRSGDYVVVSTLNNDVEKYNDSTAYANTRNDRQSGTDIGSYTKVTYTNIDPSVTSKITINFRRSAIVGSSGDNCGYLLIPKNQ
jgi:surface protein